MLVYLDEEDHMKQISYGTPASQPKIRQKPKTILDLPVQVTWSSLEELPSQPTKL